MPPTEYQPLPTPTYPDPADSYSYETGGLGGYQNGQGFGYGEGTDGFNDYGYGATGLGLSSAVGYPKQPKPPGIPSIPSVGAWTFDPEAAYRLSRASDEVMLRLGPHVYDLMGADDQIASCVQLLAMAVLGGELVVEPAIVAEPGERLDESTDGERKKDIEKAKKYADECRKSVARVPGFIDELEAVFTEGVVRGCGLAEPTWVKVGGDGEDKDDWTLGGLRCRPNYSWAWIVDGFSNPVGILAETLGGPRWFPRDGYLVYSNAIRRGDPRGTSDLRPAYDSWNLKLQARPQRAKWIAQFANPTAKIIYDPEQQPLEFTNPDGSIVNLTPQQQAEKVGANVHGGSFMCLPKGWEADLIESSVDGGAFNDHEDAMNRAMARAILLNARTTNEAEHGSKADSESSGDVTGMKVARRQKSFSTCIERDIFGWIVVHNHGESERHLTPKVHFRTSPHLQSEIWTAFAGLVGAKAVPPSIAPKCYPLIGLPVPNPDDFDGDNWQGWGAPKPDPAMVAAGLDGKPVGKSPMVAGNGNVVARAVSTGKSAVKPKKKDDKAAFGKGGGAVKAKGAGKKSGNRWVTIRGHAVQITDGKITKGGVPGLTHDEYGTPLAKPGHAPAIGKQARAKKKAKQTSGESPPARVKHVASEGNLVGKGEHVAAEKNEKALAKAVGGKHLKDNESVDVVIHHKETGKEHGLEVKSLLKGKKQSVTMHEDALLRKVEYAAADPNRTVHTVAIDHRDRYDKGAHAEHHSGQELYYKRGAGPYALSKMHKVKDHEELNHLIHAKDHELPEAARGHLPSGAAADKLREGALKAHESRLRKDRALKAKKKAERMAGHASPP